MLEDADSGFLSRVERNRRERDFVFRNTAGDLISGNSKIPQGNFARFLGFSPPTAEETAGKGNPSAGRVIELALLRAFDKVGRGAMETGMMARNQYISHGPYENMPGRVNDLVKDGLDASRQAHGDSGPSALAGLAQGSLGASGARQYAQVMRAYQDESAAKNMRYLEMQYKFLYASLDYGTVSNLMKIRHEATRTAIREIQ